MKRYHAHLGELVLKHKQNIDSFLDEKLQNIRFLADSIDFGNCVGQAVMIAEDHLPPAARLWHGLRGSGRG
jgi:two-component system NtrC family sensor kinase